MSDLVKRLRGYNTPDRTIPSQRQMATDIHRAADRIEELEGALHDCQQLLFKAIDATKRAALKVIDDD